MSQESYHTVHPSPGGPSPLARSPAWEQSPCLVLTGSRRPHPGVVQPPPLRQCSPSGEASGTNQQPGVVRPSGWGLIDTRWPLPRGRLGGGSAGLGGQVPGRGAAPRPGRFRPPQEG